MSAANARDVMEECAAHTALGDDHYLFSSFLSRLDALEGLSAAQKGEHIACLEARKHYAWYLKGVPYAGYYKEQISHVSTLEDIYRVTAGIKRDLSDSVEIEDRR